MYLFVAEVFIKNDPSKIGSYNKEYFSEAFNNSAFQEYFFGIFWFLAILFVVLLVFIIMKIKSERANKKQDIVLDQSYDVKGYIYICRACGYKYKTRDLSEKCERWCLKNKSCNLDIIKYGEAPR